jgi:PIN domain nuclease of toxin-antitoxin system
MSAIVLDASALLALLKEEPGAAEVAGVLAGARMSAVNLAEVVSHFVHAGMPQSEVDAMLSPLPITIVAADANLARIAGHLRLATAGAGLSLGDRFCIALALHEALPAWTADKQWRLISNIVDVEIVVIR